MNKKLRLGVLGSTRGTHLTAIADAINEKQLAATIEIVYSNKPDAYILERAHALGLNAEWVDATGLTREEYDAKISALFKQHEVELIVLIGYMRILSAAFIQTWKNKIINVHPSLLPAHAGKMDLDVHRAVLVAKELESGCTVHYVTEQVDAGPIVIQKKCEVLLEDTPESLKARVQQCEAVALIEAIKQLSRRKSSIF